jgi:DHA1 family multidrug resistance protein-like MFS transporter
MTFDPIGRARRWNDRWRPIVPILVAEFVALVGFGALLPVLPLYIVEQGVDPTTLGLILAAWPAARLVFEPVFGWLADRTSRRGLMLLGLVVLTVSTILPLAFHGPLELFILRFISGIGVSMYDPAARGTIVEETEEDERGEAFGLYSAAQMGGLIFGPVIGALGASAFGSYAVPFIAAGVGCVVAAVYLLIAFHPRDRGATVQGRASLRRRPPQTEGSFAEYGADSPEVAQRVVEGSRRDAFAQAPLHELWNRPFVAALVMNFGLYFAIGVYEVVWALFLQSLGGSVEWIGVTYVLFALPVVFLAPLGGRLVDRHGATTFVIVGGLAVASTGFLYALSWEPYLPGGIILVEATADAFLGPALYAILAIGTPRGRASTAQGIYGSAGTIAFIVSSLAAGWLFSIDERYPFVFFSVIVIAATGAFWIITRGVRLTAESPSNLERATT